MFPIPVTPDEEKRLLDELAADPRDLRWSYLRREDAIGLLRRGVESEGDLRATIVRQRAENNRLTMARQQDQAELARLRAECRELRNQLNTLRKAGSER